MVEVAGSRRPARSLALVLGVTVFGAMVAGVTGTQRAWGQAEFRRGDTDADGVVTLTDSVRTFGWLFLGGVTPTCLDAADTTDDGGVDVSDGVAALNFLFLGGAVPPAPGPFECGADPTADALGCASYAGPGCGPGTPDAASDVNHVLSRLAYGPAQYDLDRIETIGLDAYVDEQLRPHTIDESDNNTLLTRERALFETVQRTDDREVLPFGGLWRFFRGSSAPPATWRTTGFDDSTWEQGFTSIGYGDGDDATTLDDMQGGYLGVFLRKRFNVSNIDQIDRLVLRANYDDAFVAFINGRQVARSSNISAAPAYNAPASSEHEAGSPEDFDITAFKSSLVEGENTIAVELHNVSLASSDATIDVAIVDRTVLPGTLELIGGVEELQELTHIRGVYSRRQLQTVLAEFWENHFTTDVDKVAEYFNALRNSDASDAMGDAQAYQEAAHVEYREYQFLFDNALGNFGDLLLYSATSPSMLIYLDNVLNFKRAPNENYAREIFELSALGVASASDVRYTQRDLEQLARCFTGWTVCKVAPENELSFPLSATSPPTECGVQYTDNSILNLGAGWKYFKGTREPSPDPGNGSPTTAWADLAFDDSTWLNGSTGIGYGDGDDATNLSDMQNGYRSVYLRRRFNVTDPQAIENFIFDVAYDDGYVAYLNGQEVARSPSMADASFPPAFDEGAELHEVDESNDLWNLNRFRDLLVAGTNVLAIQVHNNSLSSSDLSMRPRLMDRHILPGSIENGDPGGIWTFKFDPDEHDTDAKVIFQGTPQVINIPAGRTGPVGVRDALDVVERLVDHPRTAEFICIKLIQKFVSDEMTLAAWSTDRTSIPVELRALLADAITAWNSTTPRGNIETVMRAILSPADREGPFWDDLYRRNKVKTPIEFINSSLRALDAVASGNDLPAANTEMGMVLFQRDEPDGWSELGLDWIDTGAILARMQFVHDLSLNRDTDFRWNALSYFDTKGLETAADIVDHFDDKLFGGSLPSATKELLIEFVSTDVSNNPLDFSRTRADFRSRVEDLLTLVLSLPNWQYQ